MATQQLIEKLDSYIVRIESTSKSNASVLLEVKGSYMQAIALYIYSIVPREEQVIVKCNGSEHIQATGIATFFKFPDCLKIDAKYIEMYLKFIAERNEAGAELAKRAEAYRIAHFNPMRGDDGQWLGDR